MRARTLPRAGEAIRLAVLLLATTTAPACGDQSFRDWLLGPSSSPTSSAAAPAAPSSLPTPVPVPTATPPPSTAPTAPGGNFPNNNSPVVAVHAKVFFIECDGAPVPGTEYATSSPASCRVHLDATPRDAGNNHTRATGGPTWYADGARLNDSTSYTPVLTSRATGSATAYCYVDGVRSNDVNVTFY